MFIEYLNKEEKEVFFSLALDLVKVDDAFSLDEKEKIKRSNIENKPLLPLKVYSLLFFMMYEIFIFFIYPDNWILFVCFNLFVFIILFHKIEEDKEANK